jgi:hypothetical protein
MPIEIKTSLMLGGLDLASPPIAMPPGKAISASNYEPDVAGYTSLGGYERFDGHSRPSDATDPTEIASRRSAIGPVPGTGPVRGVWVYSGDVYAFRDIDVTSAGMYKASDGGWVLQTFGSTLPFVSGNVAEFVEGEYVVGGTSAASTAVTLVAGGHYDFTNHNFYGAARSPSMYFASGVGTAFEWSGTVLTPINTNLDGGEPVSVTYLVGYLVLTVTMTIASPGVVTLNEPVGSPYTVHGYTAGQSIVFATTGALPTGVTAGTTYYVIATGLTTTTFQFSATLGGAAVDTSGSQSGVHSVARANLDVGDFIAGWDGSFIIVSATFDAPTYISHFKNYLFLGYSTGTLLHSSLGEPLEFISTTGAGEMSFGDRITGLMTAAATSLLIFAQNRIDYLTGSDATEFMLQPITDVSGAQPYTAQMMDNPMFLDDGGVRSLPTTAAFGDWRMGTVTQSAERLIRQKRDEGIEPVASIRIKAKDQYRLFWADGTGITVYIGRKYPETLPFKLPIEVFCACAGEVENGLGDRLLVGCQDGFVYEMNRGTSFDGAAVESYIRLPFTAAGSPMQETRWTKATFEIDSPDDISVGVAFDVDYARGLGGVLTPVDVDAGTAIISTDGYAGIDWAQPIEGRLEYHLAGIGPNIAATLVTESAIARQHTISSQTYNFSRRRLKR